MVDDSVKGTPRAYGGVSQELYQRISAYYATNTTSTTMLHTSGPVPRDAPACYQGEPHVTEAVARAWLQAEGVALATNVALDSASLELENGQTRLSALKLANGSVVTGGAFVDASYEGDVLPLAKVPFALGREGVLAYNESFAGKGLCGDASRSGQPGSNWQAFDATVSALETPGGGAGAALLPGVWERYPSQPDGGDSLLQSFNFRICLTTSSDPAKARPWPPPASRNASLATLLERYIVARSKSSKPLQSASDFFGCFAYTHGKCDANDGRAIGLNPMGQETWTWPEAPPARRRQLQQSFVDYTLQLLHHVANSTTVPAHVRADVARYRLCADEWPDLGHFPFMPYVREGRRMQGQALFTQADWALRMGAPLPLGWSGASAVSPEANTTIGLGSWFLDCHALQHVALPPGHAGEDPTVANEGCIQYGRTFTDTGRVFGLPLFLLLPANDSSMPGNLLVTGALSSSHVGLQPLRIEPTFMVLGQAAGTLAALIAGGKQRAWDTDLQHLVDLLRTNGAILSRDAMPSSTPQEKC